MRTMGLTLMTKYNTLTKANVAAAALIRAFSCLLIAMYL